MHIPLCRRVFHPTPPFATLLGFQLLKFSHTRLETVDDRYGYGTFFSPNCSISSLRCTCLIFRFFMVLCHRSSLENAHHCALQPCKDQQWRINCFHPAYNSLPFNTVWKGQPSTGSHQCLCFGCQLCESHN
jgi:hypothetical protein